VTRRAQTTKERATEYIRAAFGECGIHESEPNELGIVRVILFRSESRRWSESVVNVTGKGVNEAWEKAMRRARVVAEAQIPHFDARIAQAEIAADRERAARLRLFDVLNSDGTTEAT
jgi:hypothetical protein